MTTALLLSAGSKRQRTRDALLVAAQDLLAERAATGLTIRDITARAGIAHGGFYNYYPDIGALVEDLADLLFATHSAAAFHIRSSASDAAAIFAQITRQTLHLIAASPALGRLVFDAGLPIERFVSPLRDSMYADVARGLEDGVFRIDDPELAVSMVTGSLIGTALDLHRGVLSAGAIDIATERLLGVLGVPPAEAHRYACAPLGAVVPLPLPLRWLSVRALLPYAGGDQEDDQG